MEETILLSNSNQPYVNEKVIKIKKIELSPKNQIGNSGTPDTDIKEIQKDLEQVQNELNDLLKEKESLIQETKDTINHEKNNWEIEKQQWIEEAKEQGHNEGFKVGKKESLQSYQQLLDKANSLTASALKDYHLTVEKSNETILDLAIHTARKILNQQISENPNEFLTIVHSAIKEIKDQPVITIYLHPDNYENVLQQKEELVQILENESKLSIYSKEDIAVNSCLIEHPFGQIDASIDTQLKQIRSALYTVAMENKK